MELRSSISRFVVLKTAVSGIVELILVCDRLRLVNRGALVKSWFKFMEESMGLLDRSKMLIGDVTPSTIANEAKFEPLARMVRFKSVA